MGVAIQIKRSQVTNTPASLNPGELAWSDASNTLFVGLASGSGLTAVGGSGVFATLASPALTGTPTAPTAGASNNTTQIATTAFVHAWVPLTTTGDLLYGDATNSTARLPGNTSATKKFLSQTGNGTVSSAPAWTTITATDVGAVASVTAGDSTVAIGGTGTNPTVAVATGGITNTQVSASAAIAYSKLALSASIVNADIASGAAIAYAKLNLAGSIVNSDIASLSGSKINAGTVGASFLPTLDAITAPAADVSLNSHKITNLANGTAAGDAVTFGQFSAAIQGMQPKPTATCATTTGLPSYTYANGSSGVGATITFTATGVVAVDGHTLALNDLVLVLNETSGNAPNNGLYTVTTAPAVGVAGVLTRHADMDQAAEFSGAFVPVQQGTINAGSLWLCSAAGSVTVGTTSIGFTELNKATDLAAGTGITISGNTVSISNVGTAGTYTSVTTNAQGQVTAGADIVTSNGGVFRTAAGTFAARTITGTASRVSVTNGNGVGGNPTIDIDAAYAGQASITTLGTVVNGTVDGGTF